MNAIPFHRQDQQKKRWAEANLHEFCDRPGQEELRQQYLLRGLTPTGNLGARILNLYENQKEVPSTGEYDAKDHLGQNILKDSLERDPARLHNVLKLCQENRNIQNLYALHRLGKSPEDQADARRLASCVDEFSWRVEEPLNEILWEVAPKLEQIGIEPAQFCIKSGPGDTLDSTFDDQPSNYSG